MAKLVLKEREKKNFLWRGRECACECWGRDRERKNERKREREKEKREKEERESKERRAKERKIERKKKDGKMERKSRVAAFGPVDPVSNQVKTDILSNSNWLYRLCYTNNTSTWSL